MKTLLLTFALLLGTTANKDGDKKKEMLKPQIQVQCPANGVADQKAQQLLNQNLGTLTDYFNEKCTELNAVCTASMTVQEAEQKICEFRRLKARLFPTGGAGQRPSFDCVKYTPEEKRGCQRPSFSSTMNISPNIGAQPGGAPSWWNNIVNPNAGSTGNVPTSSASSASTRVDRNVWDTLISTKIQEYKQKMAVYRQAMGISNRPVATSFGSYAATLSSMPTQYISGTQAYPTQGGTTSTYGGGMTQQRMPNQPVQQSGFGQPMQPGVGQPMQPGVGRPMQPGVGQPVQQPGAGRPPLPPSFTSFNVPPQVNRASPATTRNQQPTFNGWNSLMSGSRSTPQSTANTNQARPQVTSNSQPFNPYAPPTNTFTQSNSQMFGQQNTGNSGSNQPSVSGYGESYGATTDNSGGLAGYGYGAAAYSNAYGGGGLSGVNSQLASLVYEEAMRLKRCLPPGSIDNDMYGGIYSSYGPYGEKMEPVADPLLVICRVRDDPTLFREIEEKVVDSFLETWEDQCKDYSTLITAEVNNIIANSVDPVDYIKINENKTYTFQQMIVWKCAIKSFYQQISANIPITTVGTSMRCSDYQSQITQMKNDMKVMKMMKEMEKNGEKEQDRRMSYIYPPMKAKDDEMEMEDPMKKLTEQLFCSSQRTRDLIYSKLTNMKLAVCMMVEMTKMEEEEDMALKKFMKMWHGYIMIAKERYMMKDTVNVGINGDATQILNDNYAQIQVRQPAATETVTKATLRDEWKRWLLTFNGVFNAKSTGECNDVLRQTTFVADLQTAVTQCQRGVKDSLKTVMKTAKEEIMQRENNPAEQNRVAICMTYVYASQLPSGSTNTQVRNELVRSIFAKKMKKWTMERLEKSKNSPASLSNNCESIMTPTAKAALSKIVNAILSGDLSDVENQMELMINPTDAVSPLTDTQRAQYKACKIRKIFEISRTPYMCGAFQQRMNTVRQAAANLMTSYQSNQALNFKKEMALLMITQPMDPVSLPGQSQGTCTGNYEALNINGAASGQCEANRQCCQNPQFVCDNGSCRITPWQRKFCLKAAAAEGISSRDPYTAFMKMLKDTMEKQLDFALYNKLTSSSSECNQLLGVPLNVGTSYGGTSSGTAAAYASSLSLMGFNPSMQQDDGECKNMDDAMRNICMFRMVYPAWEREACNPNNNMNPYGGFGGSNRISLFTDYDIDYNPMKKKCSENTMDQGMSYGGGVKYRDCEVKNKAASMSVETRLPADYLVYQMYLKQRDSPYGGGYGSPYQNAGAYSATQQGSLY